MVETEVTVETLVIAVMVGTVKTPCPVTVETVVIVETVETLVMVETAVKLR